MRHFALLLGALSAACASSPLKLAGPGSDTPTPATEDSGGGEPVDDDTDGDGHSDRSDCAPTDPSIHPGATEVCNGLDDDCDGETDEGVLLDFYADTDGDGHGALESPVRACAPSSGVVETSGDCNDADPSIHPGATDACDSVDNDCDGTFDEDGFTPVWFDADGDGYGNDATTDTRCPDVLWVTRGGDCDDINGDIHPGATELCNTFDDDCDGVADSSAVCPCDVEYWPDSLHPYLFCTAAADWQTHANDCSALGYELVTFDSAAEGTWVESVIFSYPDNYWWIGFTDAASEGSWSWMDGSPVTYENWASSEPNNGHGGECVAESAENCAMLKWSGAAWNDYPCGCGWPYAVCEGASEYRPQ